VAQPLSAISLLLTTFTVLFGLWHPGAKAALELEPERYRDNRNEQISQVKTALYRMGAMIVVAVLLALIFAKRAVCIVWSAFTIGGTYDDQATAFVVAEGLLICLVLIVGYLTSRPLKRFRKFKSNGEITGAEA
jgi:uncharacterized membrane protein